MSSRVYIGGLTPRCRESDVERFLKSYGNVDEIMMKNGFCFVEFQDGRDASDAAHDLNGRELCGNKVVVELARGTPRGSDRFAENNAKYVSSYDRDRRGYGGDRDYRDRDRGYGGGPPSRWPPSYGRSGGGRDYGRNGGGYGGGYDRRRYPPPTRSSHRLVVENLANGISWQDLKDFMRQAGEVVYSDVYDRKNEGVVEFASLQDMRNALDRMDGKELHGRKVKLVEESKRDGGDRRGRSSGKGRRGDSSSRSRSPSSSRSRSRSRDDDRKPTRQRSVSRGRSDTKSPASDHAPIAKSGKDNKSVSPKKQASNQNKNSVNSGSESDT